jgi:hypothetical protein
MAASPDQAYRPFIVASLLLGILLGFALGVHTAVSRLTGGGDPLRAAELIQAHGQVQLLGFAGLYVMGMSLRLLPRISGARLAYPALPRFVLILTAAGLVTRAVILPFLDGSLHDGLLLLTSVVLLAAAALFALVIAGTARRSKEPDPTVNAFVLGAVFAVAAAVVSLIEAADAISDGLRTLPYLADNAVLQLELSGFIVAFIAGVSFRAVPTMVGVHRPEPKLANTLVGILAVSVTGLAATLLILNQGSSSAAVARLASLSFAVFGAALLGLSWAAGPIRSRGNRLRPASQTHLWLVRSAFAWLAIAGIIAVYAGVAGLLEGSAPAQLEFDAVRHSLGVGVITSLIAGMSLMIVPEFAAQRQHSDQRGLALVLVAFLNLAALLRVAPSLAGSAWSYDLRNASMAVAGTLAELAVILFAVSLLRLVFARQPDRRYP